MATSHSHSVEVSLLGQKLILKSTESDELVKDVITVVNIKLKEVEKRAKTASKQSIALLALLELAEEYVKSKRKVADYRREMDHKAGELLKLLETDSR